MKTIRYVIRLVARNFWTLLGFEALLRLATALALAPLVQFFLDNLMALYGYSFITLESLPSFVSHPGVIAAIILLLLILSAISIFDVSAVLIIFDESREDQDISIKEAAHFGLIQALRTFAPNNILLPLYALFLVPLLNLGLTSNVINSIPIPEFVMDYINHNDTYLSLYLIGMAALSWLLLRIIYTFPSFLLEQKSFTESLRRSFALTKRHFWGDFGAIIGLKLIFDLLLMLVTLVPIGLAALAFMSNADNVIKSILVGLSAASAVFVTLISVTLGSALSYAILCARYWNRLTRLGEVIPNPEPPRVDRHVKGRRNRVIMGLTYASFIVICTASSVLAYIVVTDTAVKKPPRIPPRLVEVTAHRGASAYYPENTMAAFRGAKLQGADWCELDVQQSKDGKLFISHDSNFKRISGVKKNAWELTWDEISKLDASGVNSKQFKGERYPLLSQVLAWAKRNNMRLNIEIKPSEHYKDIEAQTAKEIRDAGMQKQVIMTSQSYDCVKKIAQVAPDIQRAYVMSLVYGKIDELSAADIYSTEENSCTERFVSYAHENNKQVLAWTVNEEANMQRMIDNGVDNIITNDVLTAKRVVSDNAHADNSVEGVLSQIYNFFAA